MGVKKRIRDAAEAVREAKSARGNESLGQARGALLDVMTNGGGDDEKAVEVFNGMLNECSDAEAARFAEVMAHDYWLLRSGEYARRKTAAWEARAQTVDRIRKR